LSCLRAGRHAAMTLEELQGILATTWAETPTRGVSSVRWRRWGRLPRVVLEYESLIRVLASKVAKRWCRRTSSWGRRLLLALAVRRNGEGRPLFLLGGGWVSRRVRAPRGSQGDCYPLGSVERPSTDCPCAVITIQSMPDGALAHTGRPASRGVVEVMPAGQYASGHAGVAKRRASRDERSDGRRARVRRASRAIDASS